MVLTKKNPNIRLRPERVERLDLSGKKLVAVGGTNGLGQAIARQAHARGAEVTVVGRTFRDEPAPRLDFVRADLSSMEDALRLGGELPVEDADVLLFSSGIIAAPTRELTPEGVERDVAISFLNRVAILRGAAARLGTRRPSDAPAPRVFVMGSPGSGMLGFPDDLNTETRYTSPRAHGNTIAGNEALALGAAGVFPGPRFYGLGPGLIKTGIRENYLGRNGSVGYKLLEGAIGLFLQSPEKYAQRIVPLLFTPELEGHSGVLFNRLGKPVLPTKGFDGAYVARLMVSAAALLDRVLVGPAS
jgi:NAD(P)-dependent dehydrogenase (short-subunit alcohol dehydrogenase family)